MKKLFIGSVLAMLVVTPTIAKQKQTIPAQAAAAQAYVPSDSKALVTDKYTVVVNGLVTGRDPDANVRLMLRRDPFNDAP